MPINEKALARDREALSRHTNFEQFEKTVLAVFSRLKELKPSQGLSFNELYDSKENLTDIDLYLAFHLLCSTGVASGVSPYAVDEEGKIHSSHRTMTLQATEKTSKVKSLVRVFTQDFDAILASKEIPFCAEWTLPRKPAILFFSEKQGQAAAEEAFRILNAPEEALSPEEIAALMGYHGPSLSVGDKVETIDLQNPEILSHLCKPQGWETVEAGAAITQHSAKETPKDVTTQDEPKIPPVTFYNQACSVNIHHYNNNRIALLLTTQDGEPMATASVNMPEINLPEDHVLIKNYSENAPPGKPSIAEALCDAGLVEAVNSYSINDFGSQVVEVKLVHPELRKAAGLLDPTTAQPQKGSAERVKAEKESAPDFNL